MPEQSYKSSKKERVDSHSNPQKFYLRTLIRSWIYIRNKNRLLVSYLGF